MDNLRIILCDPKKALADAWKKNIQEKLTSTEAAHFTVRESLLDAVPDTFDCILSPANSFGTMDGASDGD